MRILKNHLSRLPGQLLRQWQILPCTSPETAEAFVTSQMMDSPLPEMACIQMITGIHFTA